MAVHLIVTAPFADYQRGERIEDPDTVDAILADERCHNVVKVAAEPPAPAQEG
jgi:hypothetical protein